MECDMMFETDRELLHIERVSKIPQLKNTHVFAICISCDNKPILAARRTSFAFQNILSTCKSPMYTMRVPHNLLKYMYPNEIKEISLRLVEGYISKYSINNNFEELIMLGGKLNSKFESIEECLIREINEESDNLLTVLSIGNDILKVTTVDKLINKTFISFCTTCYVKESLTNIIKADIFNIEVRALKCLYDVTDNDKYHYLSFIYNTLCISK
ncbi:mutt motif [Cetacean poxvirus 1]|nr:mutt motif [Cetacean poxvirus 1]